MNEITKEQIQYMSRFFPRFREKNVSMSIESDLSGIITVLKNGLRCCVAPKEYGP